MIATWRAGTSLQPGQKCCLQRDLIAYPLVTASRRQGEIKAPFVMVRRRDRNVEVKFIIGSPTACAFLLPVDFGFSAFVYV